MEADVEPSAEEWVVGGSCGGAGVPNVVCAPEPAIVEVGGTTGW